MSRDELKKAAAQRAVEYLQDGMVVGLGSGSTASYATLAIAQRLRQGTLRDIVAIPTSEETATLARREGIPLVDLDDRPAIDVTIDGADEVDPQLNVIKGLGGFLLREKIVAYATRREIIVVDDSKLVTQLGTLSPVPVEVVRFGWQHTREALINTGAQVSQRMTRDGAPFITDEGHYIIDCRYPGIAAPHDLVATLNAIPGVVDNGLFLDIVQLVVIASQTETRIMER
ncbi:MAG TPA: ribose-5-phosphate isomerase RpiA [Chloroflexi bacterium]|jgi:ribose 5-phosphate isomerase A|nr:ribose-5-phosphate isomerase RpiA [Chloroflexota bacterium]